METIYFYTQLIPKNKQNLDLYLKVKIPKKFVFETSIYINENEFGKIKNMNKKPNKNLKKLLKNI